MRRTRYRTPALHSCRVPRVRSIDRDDAPIPVGEGVEADIVDLAPASCYRIALEIPSRAPKGEGAATTLEPGSYKLVVLLPLAWTIAGERHDVTLRSDELAVTLTP